MAYYPFRQILFWPLQLEYPHGSTRPGIQELAAEITSSKIWKELKDVYERGDERSPEWGTIRQFRYAEFAYFHPFVQRFLYRQSSADPAQPTAEPDFLLLGRDDIKTVHITLGENDNLTLDVDRVHLYLFRTRVAILVVEVSSKSAVSREQGLDFLDRFRRVFPPYWENFEPQGSILDAKWSPGAKFESTQTSGAEIPQALLQPPKNLPILPHWAALLEPLAVGEPLSAKLPRLRILGDDRMASMAFLGLEDPFRVSDDDMVRFAVLDGPRSTPYSQPFLASFEQTHCYDRFWDTGPGSHSPWTTRYLTSGEVFTAIGDAGPGGWFFCNIVQQHFRMHYFQMGLILQLQRASLLIFQDRISHAATLLPDKWERCQQEAVRIQTDLAEFSSRFWFSEISPQTQARELFQLWSRNLQLEQLKNEVFTDKAALASALSARWDREQTELANGLARAGFIFAPVALATGFLGMNVIVDPLKDLPVLQCLPLFQRGWLIFAAALLAFSILSAMLWFHIRSGMRREGDRSQEP